MNELELLQKLIEVEENTHILHLKIQIWSNEAEKAEFIVEHRKGVLEIENIKTQLVEIGDKSSSANAKSNMLKQLRYYVEEINKARPGLALSRNQGMNLKNELFAGIVRDMNYLIQGSGSSIRIPAYLHYTTNPEGSIDIVELTGFLETEARTLQRVDSPNYLKLRDFMEGFTERIIAQYIHD